MSCAASRRVSASLYLHLRKHFDFGGTEVARIDCNDAFTLLVAARLTHTQPLDQRTLNTPGRLMQTAQNFKLNFFLKTGHFLKQGYETRSDLAALPPCCFTISKRGQHDLTGESQGF